MIEDQNWKKKIPQKWLNLHERTAIGWLKRKTKFQIFPIFIFRVMVKNNETGNSMNVVECKPVPTRVLNPKAGEASYKPKQRSYKSKKYSVFSGGNIPGWNVPGGVFRGEVHRESKWHTSGKKSPGGAHTRNDLCNSIKRRTFKKC